MAKKNLKKIYVLDTSVIIYDHFAINNFEEHDVALPITVLEELDNFKKGSDTKNYAAREVIRFIDELSGEHTIQNWLPLPGKGKGRFKVVMNHYESFIDANQVYDGYKQDHNILNAALKLQEEEKGAKVILVTKDVNLRIKAKALDLIAEDYETGKVKDITNRIYTGKQLVEGVDGEIVDKIFEKGKVSPKEVQVDHFKDNNYFILKNCKSSALAYYNSEEQSINRVDKLNAYGISPKNAEQTFALHAILNPDVKIVTIQGVAGTGKTLLALAGAIQQRRNFKQIYLARPIIPLGNKDIGYLPGDEKAKINPYMEPLWDNLKFIKNQFGERDKEFKRIDEMVKQEKILITPLAYIRGRSLSNVIFIVDEAQNLTPHEVKTIITRAGENTKIIFTGDVFQIDTPYLDSESNGLSYLIDRLKGNKLFAHITLEKGERSELANLANQLL